ncbi:MAG: winged helix-turn-helix domain-containing protein [Roseburia sp.]|nr:winged helix-turn-helix domain-containing protein [Roseburia sp.]MCM1097981.1 winged helix-turn-helix domain-containing protein [Ruminococcus flavefaciens]
MSISERKTGERRRICFGLLGAFFYGDGENGKSEFGTVLRAGRKTLSFLQYLIVNHARSVSAEELIEAFWPGEDIDPANSLRNAMFRVRNLLKEMFPGYGELLVTLPGCYVWNPDLSLELDTERFEKDCLAARREPEEAYLEKITEAVSLYRGDFLSANDDEWAIARRQYYRTLYLDACKTALPLLEKKEHWIEIIGICEKAYRIDFSAEEFTAQWMKALIAMGQSEQAAAKYEAFRAKIVQELEIHPSTYLEEIYTLAVELRKTTTGIQDIFELTCKKGLGKEAFFCTFEMLQNIVALEQRHLARSKETSALVIVRLEREVVPATDARRLERILRMELRSGDPVARLGADSYILMLSGNNEENARLVMGRIDSAFHKTYRHSKAFLTYHVSVLDYAEK